MKRVCLHCTIDVHRAYWTFKNFILILKLVFQSLLVITVWNLHLCFLKWSIVYISVSWNEVLFTSLFFEIKYCLHLCFLKWIVFSINEDGDLKDKITEETKTRWTCFCFEISNRVTNNRRRLQRWLVSRRLC